MQGHRLGHTPNFLIPELAICSCRDICHAGSFCVSSIPTDVCSQLDHLFVVAVCLSFLLLFCFVVHMVLVLFNKHREKEEI